MADPGKPTTKPVATRKRGTTTYKLYKNGQLWTAGRHGHLCGYLMDPCDENMDTAVDNHEEELACLMADARAEFGF